MPFACVKSYIKTIIIIIIIKMQVKNEDDDFGWGVVINFRKKANQKMSSPKDDSLVYIAEILLNCSKESVKNSVTDSAKPPKEGEKGEMAVSLSDL